MLVIVVVTTLAACDQNREKAVPASAISQAEAIQPPATVAVEGDSEDNRQFNIGNTHYLFDVSNHSPAELEALLHRAEEIRETHATGYDNLDIVLILHGPDIDIFRQENYSKHKPLVDLAAKLDAFKIIDMKICETTMSNMDVQRSEVPAFIESVPYAPDEIRRLNEEGYINL